MNPWEKYQSGPWDKYRPPRAQPAPVESDDPMLDPTRGFMSNALAGAGKALTDIYRGAKDVYYDAGFGSPQAQAENAASIAQSRLADAPLMDTGGGLLGNIAGNIAATLPSLAIPGVNTLTGAGLLGAGLGAIQPTTEEESRLVNSVIGGGAGAAGQGVANAVGRLIRPVQTTLPPQQQGLADIAQATGIPLSAANITGSKPLKIMDSVLDSLPFTADSQAARKAAQRSAWQGGLLRLTGENADEATPAVMGQIKDRIGAEFNRLSSAYDMPVDDTLLTKLADIESKYGKRLTTNQRQIVQSYIDDLTGAETIAGPVYQDARSMLLRQSDSLRNSDPMTSGILSEIRDAIDDSMGRAINASGNKDDALAWKEARKQWRMMKRIEKAADPTTGEISPKKLVNEMARKDRNAMTYGKGDQEAANLARVGKEFIAENVPDSGTAKRQFYQNLMTGGGGALGIGGLLGFVPPAALGVAALGAATPIAMQRALWSPAGKRYLTQGLLSSVPQGAEMIGGLLARGGGASLPISFGQ